jgi:hypothetical protein
MGLFVEGVLSGIAGEQAPREFEDQLLQWVPNTFLPSSVVSQLFSEGICESKSVVSFPDGKKTKVHGKLFSLGLNADGGIESRLYYLWRWFKKTLFFGRGGLI